MSALQGLLKAVTTDRVAVEGRRVLRTYIQEGPQMDQRGLIQHGGSAPENQEHHNRVSNLQAGKAS